MHFEPKCAYGHGGRPVLSRPKFEKGEVFGFTELFSVAHVQIVLLRYVLGIFQYLCSPVKFRTFSFAK
eukprot:195772-Amphidinium_carterae.1